ncbi:uncharacterized protein FIBRA_02926 [Fibroporia radiculosa]|uniref:F-box domain-containing protein n=1 Tax=Fibroporia radiculosa TaxID=599839 RepID=J4GN71_9APHY|nr:uncharacterized protein FIBRA_02926 [Fibroporia radiculosa]CCM00880.1 predicted protein [Fibroporia radiculosa]
MDVLLACIPQDFRSTADRDELKNVTTVEGDSNVRASCWDVSIAERTDSQLCDICPMVSSQLPTELWEHIIDLIADDGSHRYTPQLGQVCRGWYARCRFRSYERLDMGRMDKKQVCRLINTLLEHTGRCGAIKTVSFDLEQSIGNFGSFAVRMMQKLPRVKFLYLWRCKWESGQLHAQIFLHVTLTFGSVNKLSLNGVTFPAG